MTKEELQRKCMELQRDCNFKIEEIKRRYAIEHNPVDYGDIITDHYHTIIVERMSIYGYPVPFIEYEGVELTKKGEPKKNQPKRPNPVYQRNIISINGKPYKYVEE